MSFWSVKFYARVYILKAYQLAKSNLSVPAVYDLANQASAYLYQILTRLPHNYLYDITSVYCIDCDCWLSTKNLGVSTVLSMARKRATLFMQWRPLWLQRDVLSYKLKLFMFRDRTRSQLRVKLILCMSTGPRWGAMSSCPRRLWGASTWRRWLCKYTKSKILLSHTVTQPLSWLFLDIAA